VIRNLLGSWIRKSNRHPKILVTEHEWVNFLRRLIPIKTEHHLIRIGPSSDGGYLLPDDLKDIGMCISPGTGNATGFESDLLRYQIPSLLIDKDESAQPEKLPEKSIFLKKFVSGYDSQEFISLNTLVETCDTQLDLILQMDIEGHEYNALNAISRNNLDRFRIIVIEFHYSFDWIFKHNWDWQYAQIFSKLLENHSVVHTHPNNAGGQFSYAGISYPNLMEITFLRKDRIRDFGGYVSETHPLEFDNNSNLPTMKKTMLGIE